MCLLHSLLHGTDVIVYSPIFYVILVGVIDYIASPWIIISWLADRAGIYQVSSLWIGQEIVADFLTDTIGPGISKDHRLVGVAREAYSSLETVKSCLGVVYTEYVVPTIGFKWRSVDEVQIAKLAFDVEISHN